MYVFIVRKTLLTSCLYFFISRYKNASGRPADSYEKALLQMMIFLTTNRLPLFEDYSKMKKWKQHFYELNKINISDMLLKVINK